MLGLLHPVFSAFVLVLSHLVNGAPVQPTENIVVTPAITSPNASTIWAAGSTQNVSWATSDIPLEAQNYTVVIILGFLTSDSENLDYRHPLATQIPIMAGTAAVYVPTNTTAGSNYTVALIGDSGDISPTFTITSAPNGSVALH